MFFAIDSLNGIHFFKASYQIGSESFLILRKVFEVIDCDLFALVCLICLIVYVGDKGVRYFIFIKTLEVMGAIDIVVKVS